MHPVAFDLETHAITADDPLPRPVCISWHDSEPRLSLDVEREAGRLLGDPEALLVGHAVDFDLGVLLARFPRLAPSIWHAYEEGRVECTRIREILLDIAEGERRRGEDEPYSLGAIAERRLGRALDKGADGWRTRYAELDGVPLRDWPERARAYALDDATTTLALFHDQAARSGGYAMPTRALDARAAFALRLCSAWGFALDPVAVSAARREVEDERAEIAARLVADGLLASLGDDLFGGPSTWRKNTAAIRAAVVERWPARGDPPRTATGLVRTDADTLTLCGLDDLVRYGELEKTASLYLERLAKLGAVARSRYDALGADSSRTTSSRPNLQQLPRAPGVRECYVARPGHALVACDYDAQETRTWAQACVDLLGHSSLADRFRERPDFDPHLELAARVLGISLDDAERRLAAGDEEVADTRQHVKPASFGFPVGMGAKKFVIYARGYGVPIDLDGAQRLREHWREMRPEADGYFAHAREVVGAAGYGTLVIPRSGYRRGGVGFTDAANGQFQTLAAHASKAALFDVARRCYDERLRSPLLGSRVVNFVHDEIILETPDEAVGEAGEEVARVMIEAMARWTPDVPPRASARAMRRWSKKAKRRTDARGALVVDEGAG